MAKLAKNIYLRGSAITNIGQVRNHNEDNIHLWSGGDLLLAIVADGMGGAAAGEEASRIAVETISSKLGIDPSDSHAPENDIPTNALRSAVQEANLSIMREAVEHPSNKGMGTTVTMALIKNNEARFAHVGDSRAYRVDQNGNIDQITSDHSFVQALVEAKHITPEQAETHPMRNVLYRALGQTKELDVDTYHASLNIGDRLVLCSDGLTGHVRAAEIAEVAASHDNPSLISQRLVELANQRGGEDNISVIVIIVEEDDPQKRAERERIARQDEGDTAMLPNRDIPASGETGAPAGEDGPAMRTQCLAPNGEAATPHNPREGVGQRPDPQAARARLPYSVEGQDISYPPR